MPYNNSNMDIRSYLFLLSQRLFTAVRRHMNRKKLKNSDFSIISSNCIGGVIYHELNERFMSPTINLRIDSKSFVKFVSNLEMYLKQELIFYENDESFPAAHLGDIDILFVHYKDIEEARRKWKTRIRRINWNNLYIMLNDCDGVDYNDLIELNKVKCKNMVIFTAKQYQEFPRTFFLEEFEGQDSVGYTLAKNGITGQWLFERSFDYVSWLNSSNANCERFRKG